MLTLQSTVTCCLSFLALVAFVLFSKGMSRAGGAFYFLVIVSIVMFVGIGTSGLVCILVGMALLPLSLLHFAFQFPEGSRFWESRPRLKGCLYRVVYGATVVVAAVFLNWRAEAFDGAPVPLSALLAYLIVPLAWGIAMVTLGISLRWNYRHAAGPGHRHQVAWVIAGFALPFLAAVMSDVLNHALHILNVYVFGPPLQVPSVFTIDNFVFLCSISLIVICYAMSAPNHYTAPTHNMKQGAR